MSTTNLDTALRYLRALEDLASGEALASFFHPETVQHEFPNALHPKGQQRELPKLLKDAERARTLLSAQRYTVLSSLESGDTVALELEWTGTLAIPLRSLPVGAQLRATCGMFLTFKDGRIVSQRNYDCFEPF